MQEGEAYGAGSDVVGTPLRAEEKTRTVSVLGEEREASTRCSPGRGEGWVQQRGETRQAQWVSAVAMRDKAIPREG